MRGDVTNVNVHLEHSLAVRNVAVLPPSTQLPPSLNVLWVLDQLETVDGNPHGCLEIVYPLCQLQVTRSVAFGRMCSREI